MSTREIAQSLLRKIAQNRATLEELEKQLKADEALVFAALKEGVPVAMGMLTAEIEVKPGRRTTAWKEKAIELCDEIRGEGEGSKWAARVIAATKPGESSEKLVVKFAA